MPARLGSDMACIRRAVPAGRYPGGRAVPMPDTGLAYLPPQRRWVQNWVKTLVFSIFLFREVYDIEGVSHSERGPNWAPLGQRPDEALAQSMQPSAHAAPGLRKTLLFRYPPTHALCILPLQSAQHGSYTSLITKLQIKSPFFINLIKNKHKIKKKKIYNYPW